MRRSARRFRGEHGQAAGVESVPLGVLVLVAGTLMVVNVWAAIDTRAALDTAARDYLRAYTAAPNASAAARAGRTAAVRSFEQRGGDPTHLTVGAPEGVFGACRPVTVRLEVTTPAIRAPFLGTLGSTTVTATQTELVQPFGEAIAVVGDPTPCDG